MYTAYIDGRLMYSPTLVHEGYSILSPVVDLEVNAPGSFTFDIYPSNPEYANIKRMKSVVTVYDNDKIVFSGRVVDTEKDFYQRKNVYCEGELAYLQDTLVRAYTSKCSIRVMLEWLLQNHNNYCGTDKQIQIGEVTVTDKNDYVNYSTERYPTTYEEIKSKLLENHGGFIVLRYDSAGKRYLDYLLDADMAENPTQIIEFGVNVLTIDEFIDASGVVTVLIPEGATDAENNTVVKITGVNNGKDYVVNQAGKELYGNIWGYKKWDNITQASNLLTAAQSYLEQTINESITLNIKAVDMGLLDVDVDKIGIGQYVRVISLPHGIDAKYQCTKIKLDLTEPQQNEYSFGAGVKTMTDIIKK